MTEYKILLTIYNLYGKIRISWEKSIFNTDALFFDAGTFNEKHGTQTAEKKKGGKLKWKRM